MTGNNRLRWCLHDMPIEHSSFTEQIEHFSEYTTSLVRWRFFFSVDRIMPNNNGQISRSEEFNFSNLLHSLRQMRFNPCEVRLNPTFEKSQISKFQFSQRFFFFEFSYVNSQCLCGLNLIIHKIIFFISRLRTFHKFSAKNALKTHIVIVRLLRVTKYVCLRRHNGWYPSSP